MEHENRIYQQALCMIPKIGAITAKKLIEYLGSPEAVFREKRSDLCRIPGIGDYLASRVYSKDFLKEAELEINRMDKFRIRPVWYQESDYPWRLKDCEDGPLLLYIKGNPELNPDKIISIVGTRDATSYGKDTCDRLISDLSQKFPETIIVSGLAYGIDITAHRKALEYGMDTFAVLAHGLHTIYPSSHHGVAEKIISHGGLLSDFNTTVKPERNNFLRRNRIIAGLADATIVIESGEKGGALITAEIASSYNREVMAVPGRISDPYSAGCNMLVKRNIASILESSSDIAELLNWEDCMPGKEPTITLDEPLTDEEEKILTELIREPGIGQEILSIRTGLPINKLLVSLMGMELRNWIKVLPGNLYKAMVVPVSR